MVGASRPDDVLIHHFSIGSRASRTAYALPGRMVLVYHNITPPEYFLGVHKDLVKLCFHGRRELTRLHRRAASWRSATPSSTGRSSRRSAFRATGVLPVVPDFAHLDVHARSRDRRPASTTSGRTCMFVGRVIPNKQFEDVIRAFHAYRTRHNPRSRLLLVGLATAASRSTSRCCRRSSRGSARPTCTSSATSRTRS